MDEINRILLEFKKVSEEIINKITQDDYDSIESLLDDRQSKINELSKLEYEQEDFKKICEDISLYELENNLNNIFKDKHDKIRSEIKKIKLSKSLNNSYNIKEPVDSIFLNKKY